MVRLRINNIPGTPAQVFHYIVNTPDLPIGYEMSRTGVNYISSIVDASRQNINHLVNVTLENTVGNY
jgi:hypothetical protein